MSSRMVIGSQRPHGGGSSLDNAQHRPRARAYWLGFSTRVSCGAAAHSRSSPGPARPRQGALVTRPARSSGSHRPLSGARSVSRRDLVAGLSPLAPGRAARRQDQLRRVQRRARRVLCPRAVRTARHPGDPTGAFRVRPRGPERRRPRPRRFYHLSEVRKCAADGRREGLNPEVAAIVIAAPHHARQARAAAKSSASASCTRPATRPSRSSSRSHRRTSRAST